MSPRHLASASALALAALALPLAAPAHAQPRATPSARVAPDDGDDDAQYISGLAEKELWDMVVRESRAFLKERASHRRATLVRYLLGDALYEQGDFAGARPVFEKVLEQSGFDREREARFRAGQCALELGDAKAAAQRFEQVLAKDPGYLRAPASFLLGEARFRAKDLDGAEQAYWATIQVEDAGDYAFDAACAMCWTAKERGALDQVVQRVDACLDAAKKDDPRVAELRLLQGEAHYGLGAHAKALEAFRKVPDGPQKSAARRGAGHALVALGRDAEAADEFEALRDADPRGALAQEALVLAGAARVRAGQSQRALELLASASDAEGLYWRGRALAASNRHDEALRAYESATRAKPDEELAATIANARADSLYALGRTSEAAKVYEDAGGDYALHAAAVARANEGAYDDAIRLARSLIEKHPDSPYADATRFVLGEALFQKGDVAAARAEFEAFAKASKDAAKVREARARLAWCDFQEKKFDAAESAFAALLRDAATDAERAELEFMAARSAEERASGDQGAARSATQRFARVADRYPDSPRRPEALLRLARLVDGEAGEAFLERLAHDHPTHELADDALFDLAERRSARGALEPALAAYEELEHLVPNSEYADRAAYGRAWCEHGLGRADAAAPRLDALARKRDLDATLRASAFELLVWVDADRGDARGAEQAVRELARLDVAADRVVAAARRAQQVLVEKGEAQRGAQLVAELARDTRDPDAAARLRVEEVFARLDLAAALEDPKARAKRVDEAEQVARGLASSRPDDPAVQEALFFVGEARYDAQDFERAIA
ncbi:MAG: tetratricopeptide repeat protein, partial [Planctomycetota bacterium]